MPDDRDIYDLYKPLRNVLRKTSLKDGLGALRWYVNYTQLANPQAKPDDLEVHPLYWKNPLLYGSPWNLSVIARELILEGDLTGQNDLRRWRHYAITLDKLKDLDEGVARRYIDETTVYHHLSKVMTHQQFVWQENRPSYQTSTRYYTIFTHPPLKSIFEAFFDLELEKYFLLSTLIWSAYRTLISIEHPPRITVRPLTQDDYDKFVNRYALGLDDLKARLADPSERRMDDSFLYYFDSLKRYPLILTDLYGKLGHVCPVPTYLYWRTTDGIYYDLIEGCNGDKAKLAAFAEALGDGYSIYIGKVLNDQPYDRTVTIIEADGRIKFGDPKPDWFVVDNRAVALIECKAKRLRLEAKTDTTYSPATEAELSKLAKCVLQVYKALQYAKDGKLNYLGNPSKYYPIVATLENWYIFGDMKEKLDHLVDQLAPGLGVDASLIRDNPYAVIASDELEDLAGVLRDESLEDVMEPYCVDPKYANWSFRTYIGNTFHVARRRYEVFQSNPLDGALSSITGASFTRGSVKKS